MVCIVATSLTFALLLFAKSQHSVHDSERSGLAPRQTGHRREDWWTGTSFRGSNGTLPGNLQRKECLGPLSACAIWQVSPGGQSLRSIDADCAHQGRLHEVDGQSARNVSLGTCGKIHNPDLGGHAALISWDYPNLVCC